MLRKLFKRKPRVSGDAPAFADDPGIGAPQNVKHEFKVTINPDTGDMIGLPPTWAVWLQSSKIT